MAEDDDDDFPRYSEPAISSAGDDISVPQAAQYTQGQLPRMSAAEFERAGGRYEQQQQSEPTKRMSAAEFEQAGGKYEGSQQEPEGAFATGVRHFVHALPSVATGLGAGALYGAAGGPGGMIGGALVGGTAALAESYGQSKATEALWPEEAERLRAGAEANPKSAMVGGVGAVAPFVSVGGLTKEALKSSVGQRAISALLSGGTDVGAQLATTGTVDPTQAAIQTAGGAVFGGASTALGQKVIGSAEQLGAKFRPGQPVLHDTAGSQADLPPPRGYPSAAATEPHTAVTEIPDAYRQEQYPREAWTGKPEPHGTPGPDTDTSIAQAPTPTAEPAGTEFAGVRAAKPGPEYYGKKTATGEGGGGVNVSGVDPTLAHAIQQRVPPPREEFQPGLKLPTEPMPDVQGHMDVYNPDAIRAQEGPFQPADAAERPGAGREPEAPPALPPSRVEQSSPELDAVVQQAMAAERPGEVLRGPEPETSTLAGMSKKDLNRTMVDGNVSPATRAAAKAELQSRQTPTVGDQLKAKQAEKLAQQQQQQQPYQETPSALEQPPSLRGAAPPLQPREPVPPLPPELAQKVELHQRIGAETTREQVAEGERATAERQADMRRLMAERGYSPEQINAMTPTEHYTALYGDGPPGVQYAAQTPATRQPAVISATVRSRKPPPPRGPVEPPIPAPEALGKATRMHDLLDSLRRNRDADLPDLENDIRTAQSATGMPSMGWLRETTARFVPALRQRLDASEQRMYRAVEDRDFSKLTPQERRYVDQFKKWDAEAQETRARLAELKKTDGIPDAPPDVGFIRRLARGYQGDPSLMGNDDPTLGMPTYRGGKPSTVQERVFHGMTSADGEHHVISQTPDGNIVVYRKGQRPVRIEHPDPETNLSQLHGKTLEWNGKKFTVGDTRARDITERIPEQQYHESFTTAKASELLQLREYRRQAELFHDFKTDDQRWSNVRSGTPKEGWVRTEVPGLQHLYMEPQMAQAFDRAYKLDPHGDSWLKKVNDIAISSIFLNPIPHSLNEAYHWVVGRGEDWLRPTGYYNLFKSGADAITAVLTKNQDYVDALRARAPMVNAGRNRADAMHSIANLVGYDMKRNPHEWDIIGKKLGMAPSNLLRSVYDASASAMWTAGDIFRLQRINELKLQGMSSEAALREMARHQPDYRLPLTVLGSPKFADFLAGQGLGRLAVMFTRYHYTVFNSLADMAKNAISPSASLEERRKAFGHLFALGMLAYVAKPMLDDLAKWVTGDQKAVAAGRGPLAPMFLAKDYVQGRRELGQLITSAVTPTPVAQLGMDMIRNRDWGGRQIINPSSAPQHQAAQALEHLTQTLISPYHTYERPIRKGTLGDEMLRQYLDIRKTPPVGGYKTYPETPQRRMQRPRGAIESGAYQLFPRP